MRSQRKWEWICIKVEKKKKAIQSFLGRATVEMTLWKFAVTFRYITERCLWHNIIKSNCCCCRLLLSVIKPLLCVCERLWTGSALASKNRDKEGAQTYGVFCWQDPGLSHLNLNQICNNETQQALKNVTELFLWVQSVHCWTEPQTQTYDWLLDV